MSDPKKPVLDEPALGKLLEAAFVIQQHQVEDHATQEQQSAEPPGDRQKQAETKPATAAKKASGTPAPTPASPSPEPKPTGDAQTVPLAQIVETQQQILARGLALESALALVAQRAAEITKARGAAIGILETGANGKNLQYRAVSGALTLPLGSEVPMEKALSFNCLRSGELIRSADVNADLLLDAAECRRRGIGAFIAVPIYHDGGITGALELYFPSPNAFTEQDVHSSQLMAGLITEALAREAGVTSRKSLAAERATMLEAIEKLRPNLAALVETPAGKEPAPNGLRVKSAAAAKATTPAASESLSAISPTPAKPAPLAPGAAAKSSPNNHPAVYVCRKCGHELVGEEMFCGKCGSPRASDYQPPTMQSKLALLWQRQQALNPSLVTRPPNSSTGVEAVATAKNHHSIPAEVEPWESVLSELRDPFAEAGAGPEHEFAAKSPLTAHAESTHAQDTDELKAAALEIAATASKLSSGLDAFPPEAANDASMKTQAADESKLAGKKLDARTAGKAIIEAGFLDEDRLSEDRLNDLLHEPLGEGDLRKEDSLDRDLLAEILPNTDSFHEILTSEILPGNDSRTGKAKLGSVRAEEGDEDGHKHQASDEEKEAHDDEQAHENVTESAAAEPDTTTALAPAHPLAWTSAAKAKEAFDQLAAARKQNSFVLFWNTHRGDIYLAVAVVLLAAVVRWSITAEHSVGSGTAAAKTSHRRPAADADLSTFDKLLISLGLADAPDPPEDKGNPDTQVWIDSHSAIYYCPGADLYGKTPQGRYTTQRDAQLGQFEPAYRKACN